MENIKHFSDQFKHLSLHELHAVDELLDAEIATRATIHTDGGTSDPDNDGDNDGGIPDDPTHPD